ncbi:lipoyl(octanoyl) transferase LipB [Wenzhouxiangella marina]|uniref:Octanoyltransferase n=1 Tax=Wenzhouxiangella marina TaxID=1579979 RepID=A0A0K0XSD5_9GAMM|nr:lipoyl(octanoyl) transferase LipB [Wenzhouxiangella marina]AKS40624.1 Octanoyltransferase [Wenzhouxiangella marina]MBB6088392.1 lipoyl(octanoyl) transferase [Wenzhouxiangella marina]
MNDVATRPLIYRRLGRQAYEPVWRAMQAFTDQRGPDTPDELWLVEHDPVFTQGLAGKAEHVLNPGGIPVVQTDRGGQVTYHGPGQVVLYPLLNLDRRGLGVRCLVDRLEQAVIDLLAERGLEAERRDGAPGVYLAGAKIASIGLKVRRGCTYHGLAFNVAMDLTPFSLINPCGYVGMAMTELAAHLDGVEFDRAADWLSTAICRLLGYHRVEESGNPPLGLAPAAALP